MNEVPYARVKDIDFTSAKKLKENLDSKIDSLPDEVHSRAFSVHSTQQQRHVQRPEVPAQEMATLFAKVDKCEIKAVSLSLVDSYADQFVAKSRTVPFVSDLYETENLDLGYPELLKKLMGVKLDISEEQIKQVEKDTRSQAKSSGFFRHWAGRIGASECGVAFHGNLAQPPQSLIKTICYPNLFKVNTKAVMHGCKHEEDAIQAYHDEMKSTHVNFQLQRCGLFINQQHPFLHAMPDFL